MCLLSPNSIIWYQSRGCDAVQLGSPKKGDKHPTYTLHGVWHSSITLSCKTEKNRHLFLLHHFHLVHITWRPVGTCFASFTLAKLPRPMVLTKRYLPTCCKSSGGLARSAPPWDAFWTAVCSTQLHIIPTIPSKTSGGKWPKNSNRIWTACRRYRSMHHEFIIHKHMLTLHKFLKLAQN